MKIIESIRDYILMCPYLDTLKEINVDFLPSDATTYSIEQTPSEPVLKQYLDGGSKRQFTFVFACRMHYNDELINNISNSGFFEDFQEWLFSNTEKEILPTMENGLIPLKIEALSSGYLYDIAGDLSNGRYQIQCRLVYEKEGH